MNFLDRRLLFKHTGMAGILAAGVAPAVHAQVGIRWRLAWAKVYADYARFRGHQNLWFRFTEATFDRFMQGQKL